jgi:hypothetical protein
MVPLHSFVSRLTIRERLKTLSPLYRHVHLVTHPILRETIRREQAGLLLVSTSAAYLIRTSLNVNRLGAKPTLNIYRAAVKPVDRFVSRYSHHSEFAPVTKRLPARDRAIQVPKPALRYVQVAKPVRFEGVLRRNVLTAAVIRVRHRNKAVQEELETLSHRTVRCTERIEEGPLGTLALTMRRHSTWTALQEEAANAAWEARMPNIQATRKVGADSSNQGPSHLAPVDVESLADQVLQRIERRVTAWRERTGRV